MSEKAGNSGRPGPGSRRAWFGREAYAFLELAAACGLAVAQPLLDITGHSPDFFLFHGAGAGQVLLLVALFALAPPVVLWGVGALTGLAGRRARETAHVFTLGALFAALAVQVGKQALPLRGLPLALIAVAAGAALAVGYARAQPLRQLLRLASVGPVVFALIFVFASPASAVVLPERKSAAASAGTAVGTHPDIVVLLLDEFPQVSLLNSTGNIDAKRFPNFARLAGGSTWYRNATAVSGWTPYAVPALLSGGFPRKDAAPHYSAYPNNLFTLLGDAYDMRVQESITQLCPPSECERSGSGRGGLPVMLKESADLFGQIVSPEDSRQQKEEDYREPTVADAGGTAPTDPRFRWDRLDDNQPTRFKDFTAGLRPTGRPTLHFVHLILPHQPWRYLPSGAQYDAPEDFPNDGDPWWTQFGHQRHELQVRYADRLLGQVLDTMRETGVLDRSVLVVTADHGISFTRGAAGRAVGPDNQAKAGPEVLWVPLFIRAPGQTAGRTDDRNWLHVDLLPTLADYAGVRVPWKTDGVSALSRPRQTVDKEYRDDPAKPFVVPGPANFAVVRRDAVPVLPPMPRPDLVGRAVDELSVSDGGPAVEVSNAAAFRRVDPSSGTIPALVYGTVPGSVKDGTLLAIAVNGRIGTVIPVVPADPEGRRFAGLITDESLFRTGANRVELFVVTGDGAALQRMRM